VSKIQLFVVETSAEILRLAGKWVQQQDREVLVIADQKTAADSFVHQLSLEKGSLSGFHRLSLIGLAGILAAPELARNGVAPLSRLGREALAARAVNKILKKKGLEYFHLVAEYPGFPKALAKTAEDIRLNDVSSSFLADQSAAGKDLSRLLEEYELELQNQLLGDRLTIFKSALRFLNSGNHRFLNLPLLFLNPKLDNTTTEKFVNRIVGDCPTACFIVIRDESRCFQVISDLVGETRGLVQPGGDSDPWNALMMRRLFSSDLEAPSKSVGDHFQFFSASGDRQCYLWPYRDPGS